jgi:predicted ester cyclase
VHSVEELNKLKVELFVEAVVNQGRLELVDELVAADYLGYFPPEGTAVTGPTGVRRLVSDQRRAHPGLHVQIEDQVAEEDRVVTRWRATTTEPGDEPAGPTPRDVPFCAGISIIRLLAGKQVDSRTEYTHFTRG